MYDSVDWYKILGISPKATDDEIRQAWRDKVKQAHPDTNGSTDAEEKTKRINMAKDILLDKDKCRGFDLRRAQWRRQEEEAKRREEARRQRSEKQGRITWEQVLEMQQEIERKRREQAEERKRREQAERCARSGDIINSDYRILYDEQVLRAERAEERTRQEQRRAERAEERVEVLEDLQRNVDISFFETEPYKRPFRRYKSHSERAAARDVTPFSEL